MLRYIQLISEIAETTATDVTRVISQVFQVQNTNGGMKDLLLARLQSSTFYNQHPKRDFLMRTIENF